MTIKPGDYEGKAVEDTVQVGETNNGTLQIALNMELFDAQNQSLGQMTTFLYFSEDAAVYSYERLRALGWKGQGPDDIDKMNDIFAAKVPVRVTAPEPYTKDGKTQMGQSKLEILTGAGTVKLSKPLDMNTFKARLRTISGGGGGNATAPTGGGGGNAPPF